MKNGFILYCTQYEPIQNLSMEEKGQLLDLIFQYNINPNNPVGYENISMLVKTTFLFLKTQFDIDLQKYDSITERNRNNGMKGGRPKITQKPKKPTGLALEPAGEQGEQKPLKNPKPKKADNDKDKDNDKDNNKEKDNRIYIALQEYKSMRIKIKKPLTPRSEQMILNSLEKLGKTEEEKIALLEQSTLKCRLDIYPLKEPLPTADTDKAKLKEDYDKFKKRKDGQSFIGSLN